MGTNTLETSPDTVSGSGCGTYGTPTKLYSVTINLLKPTGYVKHQQFNTKQLYVLPTMYLCILYSSENKQRLVPLTA